MNLGYILIIIFGVCWVLSLFFGYITGLSKTFSRPPAAMDSSAIKTEEQKTIDDTKDKQKQMIEDMKEKIRDGYKKY